MIKVGDKVKIVYSYQLADMGLITLVNRRGLRMAFKMHTWHEFI